MVLNDDEGFKRIDECLAEAMTEIDRRFQLQAKQWPLVKRNRNITARNRAMKQISEMLDMEYQEMPLERPEVS
jgi:murein L,D-transpeptidase YafK